MVLNSNDATWCFCLLLRHDNDNAIQLLRKRGIKTRVVVGDPCSRRVLQTANFAEADSVVLCGLEGREPGAADAQVRPGLGVQVSGLVYFATLLTGIRAPGHDGR